MYGIQADVFQTGKVNISDTSQNSHGCQTVLFETQFQGSGDVKVFATLSHGSEHVKIHDPASVWVKSVSTSGFDACVREAGSGSGGGSVISWLAFQGSHQGIDSGIAEFDEFTSRTQCKKISLSIQNKVRWLSRWIQSVILTYLQVTNNPFSLAQNRSGPYCKPNG